METYAPRALSRDLPLLRKKPKSGTADRELSDAAAGAEPIDWALIYEDVKELYQVRRFKLRETMTHVEQKHGFKAT